MASVGVRIARAMRRDKARRAAKRAASTQDDDDEMDEDEDEGKTQPAHTRTRRLSVHIVSLHALFHDLGPLSARDAPAFRFSRVGSRSWMRGVCSCQTHHSLHAWVGAQVRVRKRAR
eukprot:2071972-Rhodomonas_salina.2